MIMVGAGTGLAPFRGFLQERAEQQATGATLAPSLLFFGCRTAADRLYADELDTFEKSANVHVYTAFSRQPSNGRKYAQHEMLAHQDECWELIGQGAEVFVCGNARTLAPGVRAALQQIYAAKSRQHVRRGRELARRPARGTPLSGGHLGCQLTIDPGAQAAVPNALALTAPITRLLAVPLTLRPSLTRHGGIFRTQRVIPTSALSAR